MDQFLEFVSYRTLLAEQQQSQNNLTGDPTLHFNLTEVADILAEFQQTTFIKGLNFTTVLLLSLYSPVFLLALLGNLLVLVTLIRERRTLLRAKNLYLLNLALADLCVTLLCMPAAVGTIVNRLWLYGEFLCKFTAFLQGVAVASSIFTLTAMSVDRYISIQHPMKSLTGMTSRQAVAIVLMTWLVSAIFMGPLLYVREVDVLTFHDIPDFPEMTFCIENWPQDYDRHIFGFFLLVVIFLLPSLTLAICYAHVGRTLCSNNDDHYRQSSIDSGAVRMRSRKRAARMLITLVVVFILFWLPYNITSLCIDLTESSRPLDVLPYTLCLGHAHSAINPIMYWMMNRRFRHNVSSLYKAVKTSTSLFCGSSRRRDVPRYV